MILSLHRAPIGFGPDRRDGVGRAYAVAFEFDAQGSKEHYTHRSWRDTYRDVGRVIDGLDCGNRHGPVYVSPEDAGPVECIVAAVSDRGGRRPDAGDRSQTPS